jgi:glucokinase
MPHVLLADIGGSTSRFAYADAAGRPSCIVTFANDTVEGIEAALARYLGSIDVRPRAAVLAVAGPVDAEEIALTNRAWQIRLPDLAARFGLSPVHAVNDFEALAWALPDLRQGDTRPLGRAGKAHGVKVVLGPGTGLGVAALVPAGSGWQVVASEGGHASFGPGAPDEEAVFSRLRTECGQVSAEMVLSGPGLSRLHRALHPASAPTTPEAIVSNARGGEPAARATTALFVRLLGRFAGDVALTFKATGGVYVCGGVALGLGSLLDGATFRAAFDAHPPHQALLGAIPAAVITCEEPGLIGCAAVAARLVHET